MTADTFGRTKRDSRLVRHSFLLPISTEAALSSDIKWWTLEGRSSLYCTPNSFDLGRGGRGVLVSVSCSEITVLGMSFQLLGL